MEQYAYIRVSTKEQNVDRQLAALEPYKILPENIFCDYQSGKNFERPAYQQLLQRIQSGDLLIIKSIDRLGRNYTDILKQWQYITTEIGADITVLDMPLLDTRRKNDSLTGVFVADLVLQILAYVAETERQFIHQRQMEGITAARSRGVRLGRPMIEMPEDFEAYYDLWRKHKISLREAARQLGVSPSTFRRRCQKRITESMPSISATGDDSKCRHYDTTRKV